LIQYGLNGIFLLIEGDLTKESYYINSVELLKGYRPAMDKLGEPIKIESLEEKDEFNLIEDKAAKVRSDFVENFDAVRNNFNLFVYFTS
jgi:hypothetical protein